MILIWPEPELRIMETAHVRGNRKIQGSGIREKTGFQSRVLFITKEYYVYIKKYIYSKDAFKKSNQGVILLQLGDLFLDILTPFFNVNPNTPSSI